MSGQRNTILTHLIGDWLEEPCQVTLRQEIIAGCRDMAEVYLETEREYHPLEEEAARVSQFDQALKIAAGLR